MAISVREMTIKDIPLGMRLKEQAGWNQTAADWQRFLRLQPHGCFVGQWQGHDVATTTTCVFGSTAWIAMVLVDQQHRHRGIASYLVEHALRYLGRQNIATVRLDATQLGQPVYERLGFVADYELIRFEGRAPSGGQQQDSDNIDRLESLKRLDRTATGTERAKFIECLLNEDPKSVRLESYDEVPMGYAMFRPGANAIQIGPVVALDESIGCRLCDWVCQQFPGQPVIADIPVENQSATRWAIDRGLTQQRRFTRMHRGDAVDERLEAVWASSGPEKG